MRIKDKRTMIMFSLVLFLSFLSVSWTLSPKNGLCFDDYSLLAEAKFSNWDVIFSMLPSTSYNDRSIRVLFLKLLIQIFDDDYIAYHLVFVMFHLCNVVLVYYIANELFQEFYNGMIAKNYAVFSAGVFGIYPTSLMSIQWISASCDFQCCNFMLLSIICYLKSKKEKRYNTFYGFCSFFAYWFSLRAKEMSLALPIILIVYEIAISFKKNTKMKLCWLNLLQCAFMLYYAFLLFSGGQSNVTSDNPYYMAFNPLIMMRNFIRYISLYFDPFNGTLEFDGYHFSSVVGIVIFACIVFYSIYIFSKKRPYLFLSLIILIGSFIVVLPMKNMQHRLYLYLPSAFMSIYIAMFVAEFAHSNGVERFKGGILICLLGLYLCNYADGMVSLKNYWLAMCEQDNDEMKQIEKIGDIPPYTNIYVLGANNTYNIFYYGPGDSLRLHFNDSTLVTELVEEFPENPKKPYLFLKYESGMIQEAGRDDAVVPQVAIDSITKEEIDSNDHSAGNYDVGLIGTYDWDDLEVRLNGEKVPYVRGEDFISFTIPEKLRISGTIVTVTLYSEEACGESEAVYIKIN